MNWDEKKAVKEIAEIVVDEVLRKKQDLANAVAHEVARSIIRLVFAFAIGASGVLIITHYIESEFLRMVIYFFGFIVLPFLAEWWQFRTLEKANHVEGKQVEKHGLRFIRALYRD
jgi:hypothetical protein